MPRTDPWTAQQDCASESPQSGCRAPRPRAPRASWSVPGLPPRLRSQRPLHISAWQHCCWRSLPDCPELPGATLPAAISALWRRVQLRSQRPQRGPRGRQGRSRGNGLWVWCQAPGPECLQLRKQPAASGTKRPLSQVGKESGRWCFRCSLKENSGQEATKVAESLGR